MASILGAHVSGRRRATAMRLAVIVRRLLPLAVSFLRDWRRWWMAGRGLERTADFHRARAERLIESLAALGPTYVKLAQVFSSRSDLIPEPYISTLSKLTDQVPPVPTPVIEHEIERAYGRPVREVFDRFEAEPLAAASLGQVHRARYAGEEVVVKVLRPGVEDLVAKDMAIAIPLIRWLEHRWPNPHVRNARTVVEEFAARVPEEMDFVHEAANAQRIRANFAGNTRVVIPRVIPELVTRNVLVLEYIQGTRVDRLTGKALEPSGDPRAVVSAVMELYLRMMLVDGFFHADPHPGNVLLTPDGKVVVLDFGMVMQVERDLRWRLVTTIFAAIRRDTDGLVAGFESLGMIDPGADREQVRGLADRLLTLAYVEMPMRERVDLVTSEVMAALYDWPVRLPSELVYFARTAALIEGLGVRFDDHFNAVTFASPIALRLRREILASLGQGELPPIDLPSAVGAALGHAAGTAVRTGREIARRLGQVLSGDGRSGHGRKLPPTLMAGD